MDQDVPQSAQKENNPPKETIELIGIGFVDEGPPPAKKERTREEKDYVKRLRHHEYERRREKQNDRMYTKKEIERERKYGFWLEDHDTPQTMKITDDELIELEDLRTKQLNLEYKLRCEFWENEKRREEEEEEEEGRKRTINVNLTCNERPISPKKPECSNIALRTNTPLSHTAHDDTDPTYFFMGYQQAGDKRYQCATCFSKVRDINDEYSDFYYIKVKDSAGIIRETCAYCNKDLFTIAPYNTPHIKFK